MPLIRAFALQPLQRLRYGAWILLIAFGLAEGWATRHVIFSDGISYIEIAEAYLRGDWAQAVNAYWSPLYSWLIALTLAILHANAYWQAATLHIVNFLAYIGGLAALEFFMRELLLGVSIGQTATHERLSTSILYLAAYTIYPVETLGLIEYNSPDEISVMLMLLLSALILRTRRTGGSRLVFLGIGVLCAVFYLARTAFGMCIPICFAIVLIVLAQQRRPILFPAMTMLLTVAVLVAPFIIAISRKEGKLTFGESGKLSYGWEIAGAARFTHWQGEPYDIGTPVHPTKRIHVAPAAYVFQGPVGGSYPPWYDPTYWYEGIHIKPKVKSELRHLTINIIVALRLFLSLPLILPALILIFYMGLTLWLRRFLTLWPILLLNVAVIFLYCLIYIEKRYIASNLLIIWLIVAVSIEISNKRRRWLGNVATGILCSIFIIAFITFKVFPVSKYSLLDLIHGQEKEKNMNYLLAQQFHRLGLRPGEKIAFVGMGTNADWARLDHVVIVGEVPIVWERYESRFSNVLLENPINVKQFWINGAARAEILQAFHKAGAVMAVTDGLYNYSFPPEWHRVLNFSDVGAPRGPNDLDYQMRLNYRYIWLIPPQQRSDDIQRRG